MTKNNNENVFELSDDEFLNAQPPVVEPEPAVIVETSETPAADAAGADAVSTDADAGKTAEDTQNDPVEGEKSGEPVEGEDDDDPNKTGEDEPSPGEAEGVAKETEGSDKAKSGEGEGDAQPKTGDPVEGAAADPAVEAKEEPINYQEGYEKIMAPFQANGKTITLNSPEEAIRLMQQGANYTRKMQSIQPHRRVLQMLQNNGLMDESQLSFLIDVNKKDPEAIKKLIKESGIDPLEIDVSSESTYREGNHRVSDEEVQFTTVLEDLASSTTGQEVIQDVRTNWDQHSREEAWKNPELLTRIHEQKDAGIYDLITAEMERQRTVGLISPQMPFLTAYNKVGDTLHTAGAFAALVDKTQTKTANPNPLPVQQQVEKQVLAVREAAPKQVTGAETERAKAAAPSRSSPRRAAPIVNPLSMSDEDFLKLGPPT